MKEDQTDNPYVPPTSVAATTRPAGTSNRRLGWFLLVAIVCSVLSAVVPFLAIPLAFLLTPAFIRALRLRGLRIESGESLGGFDFALIVVASFTYAIPSAIASVVAFCCVCFPGAWVGMMGFDQVGISSGGNPNYGLLLIGGFALLIASTLCGLLVGDRVLQRYRFFIDRPQDPKSSDDEAKET